MIFLIIGDLKKNILNSYSIKKNHFSKSYTKILFPSSFLSSLYQIQFNGKDHICFRGSTVFPKICRHHAFGEAYYRHYSSSNLFLVNSFLFEGSLILACHSLEHVDKKENRKADTLVFLSMTLKLWKTKLVFCLFSQKPNQELRFFFLLWFVQRVRIDPKREPTFPPAGSSASFDCAQPQAVPVFSQFGLPCILRWGRDEGKDDKNYYFSFIEDWYWSSPILINWP